MLSYGNMKHVLIIFSSEDLYEVWFEDFAGSDNLGFSDVTC